MQSLEQAEKLVASHAGLFEKGIGMRWSIAMKGHEDQVIGSLGYYAPNRSYHSIETGYDLHPDYWRQGFMTEAMTAIIEYGFGSEFLFHLNRIVALTGVDNRASVALLEKLGFRQEGVLREYGYWQGRYRDVRCFSLLRRDWMTLDRGWG